MLYILLGILAVVAILIILATKLLDAAGLKITDVDKFAPEMQNPDITKPAGAGDVPEANYKMIGALGVKRGDINRLTHKASILT